MPFIDINGPVVANTVYANNKLVAKDVAITLPEVTPTAVDIEAMGVMSLPLWQRLENMEYTINKIGFDMGLAAMIAVNPTPIECRWVQDVTDANGNTRQVGCKAFLKGVASVIPGFELTPGEASENEVTHTALRYQLFVDGKEICLIDRIAGIVRINGTDYMKTTNSLL